MTDPVILFIQGGGEGAYDADKLLTDYLEKSLGDTYTVLYPPMPDEEDPDYEKYKSTISGELKAIKGPVVLVGHSLGSCFLLKYLSEEEIRPSVAGIFLAATPYWGEGGWLYEGFRLRKDFVGRLPEAPLFLYHGTNDEIVPFGHLSCYAKILPHAHLHSLAGRDHQLNNDLSELVQDIQSL